MNKEVNYSSKIGITTVQLLILEVVTVTLAAAILGNQFNFPEILRQPAINAFTLFNKNTNAILFGYYTFLYSALLFIPLSYFLQIVLHDTMSEIANKLLLGFGIATAIFQSIGFVRWIFVMPFLTEQYFNHPENRNTTILIYETINRLMGMSIGEHLGFLAMGCWTLALATIILNHLKFKKWIAFSGFIIGLLLIVSVLEHFGGSFSPVFAKINFIANTLWSVWLAIIAVVFARLKFEPK